MGLAELRALKGLSNLYPKQVATEREIVVKPGKLPKPPNKRSEGQKKIMAELKKLYPVFLAKNKLCVIHGPNCLGVATCVHHSEGRIGDKVLDKKTWVASCEPCNNWCETHHAEAAKKGFKKSKFKK